MLRRGAATALIATAAVLPFELRATLPVGPLRLSSVEIFLYLTLALWGAAQLGDPIARRRLLDVRRWPDVLRASALLGAVLLLSAAAAPELRGPAFKFALRSLSGVLLAFAAADLLRDVRLSGQVFLALMLGVCVAAVAVQHEARVGALPWWLRPFHDQTFQALGQTRGSGPLQFPNIAAMALEAAIPVTVALGFSLRPDGLPAALAGVCILLLGVGATGSRAGLVGAAIAMVVMAAIVIRIPGRRRIGYVLLASSPLFLALGAASGGALGSRLRFWHEGHWYGAHVAPAGASADRLPARLAAGAQAEELLTLGNSGAMTWPREGSAPVALSYHWFDADTGELVVRDGARTPLPSDVPPGGSLTLRAAVWAPARPGRYVLAWDLVQENVVWFSGRGPGLWTEPVLVGGTPPAPRPPVLPSVPSGDPPVGRRDLWRAALAAFRAHPLLGVGPDNFRLIYGRYLGLRDPDDRLHANSLYFETLADSGVMGSLAWLCLVIALAAAARRAFQNLLAAGVSIALGTFLLHGALDYFFEFTPTFAMFWLLVGALVALDPRTSELAA
jgi:hypothetical protein